MPLTAPAGIPLAALVVLACGCGSVGWGPYLGDDCIGADGGPCTLPQPDGGDATVSDSTVEAGQDSSIDARAE
jgi:hypothetical protein